MTRDRLQTEKRLIDTIHELLTDEGFDQIKINKIAQRAKVNKVLIYRYFGGLDGLLKAYYDTYNPVVSARPLDLATLAGGPVDDFFDACCDVVLEEIRLLRNSPQAQSFLKNDLLAYQPGTKNPISSQKEAQVLNIIDELAALIQADQGRGFAAIVISGMTMLSFMAQDKRTILGIDLSTDEGWNEIERALRRIYQGLSLVTRNRIGDRVPMPPTPSADGQEPT